MKNLLKWTERIAAVILLFPPGLLFISTIITSGSVSKSSPFYQVAADIEWAANKFVFGLAILAFSALALLALFYAGRWYKKVRQQQPKLPTTNP